MTGTAPAGWYPDGSGGLRWWDGAGWTDHVAPPPPPPAQPAPQPVAVAETVLPGGTPAPRSEYDASSLFSWSNPAAPAAAAVTPSAVQPVAAVTTGFTPALSPARASARTTAAVGGWLFLAGGLLLLAFGISAFLYSTSHGYLSTGGLVSGSILTVRGAMRIRESRGAALMLPRMTALSPRTIGVLAAVGLVLVGGLTLAVRAGSAPRPILDQPMTTGTETGGWPDGYTAVGPDAAYKRMDSSSLPCNPGFRCTEVLILTRTACRLPQIDYQLLDADGRPLAASGTAGVGFQRSSPDVPTSIQVTSADPAAAYFTLTGYQCHD